MFMELKFFDICSGSLIADVMHDLLEGAAQHEAKILKYLVLEKQYLLAHSLEHHFEVCELGYMEAADRPTSITVRTLRSKGNATDQKGTNFNRIVFEVLGTNTHFYADVAFEPPAASSIWPLWVKICSLVFAPTITKDEVGSHRSVGRHLEKCIIYLMHTKVCIK